MTRKITSLFAATLVAGIATMPAYAMTQTVAPDSMLTVLEGPGLSNDTIATLPAEANYELKGCLEDGTWCAITFDATQGWIAGDAVDVDFAEVPTITFDWTDPLIIEVDEVVVPASE
ncbi:SH3 domain-containing protein [Roseivivax sp. CAU 1753]